MIAALEKLAVLAMMVFAAGVMLWLLVERRDTE